MDRTYDQRINTPSTRTAADLNSKRRNAFFRPGIVRGALPNHSRTAREKQSAALPAPAVHLSPCSPHDGHASEWEKRSKNIRSFSKLFAVLR